MKVETTKKLILTRAEQKTITELLKLFNEDNNLSTAGVWDILSDISIGSNGVAADYGFYIKIID